MTTIRKTSHPHDELLTACELAWGLKRSVRYVYEMKAKGFLMPGGRSSINQALAWLARNPAPFAKPTDRARNTCTPSPRAG